ncbi:MAG TPA: ammonia-forming cytochrome c nitrite reductase subunit c552, partial [bacterium]|nr:ammonia-forming cytochrome c nitrite reductase subunit c552 [bacterium]
QEKYLTFPWDEGSTAEQIQAYYDKVEHVDWVHKISGAPMLKAQHPDWEIFQMGIHFQRGLACADCHMPYRSEGGVKFTNHKIASPLENVAGSCQVCHRESEKALIDNVQERQEKVRQLAGMAEDLLVRAHIETRVALDRGATPEQIKPVYQLIRQAQWRWDFVVASHGGSFHAPIECARIMGNAIEKAAEARTQLAGLLGRLGVELPVAMPDISTKAKAQRYIGLDMARLEAEKADFKARVISTWGEPAL